MSETARIDVWLWRARLFKTRSQAAGAVEEGSVRLVRGGESRTLDKPATAIRAGDALTVRSGGKLRSLEILAIGARRGPAKEARLLYAEHADQLDVSESGAQTSADPQQ